MSAVIAQAVAIGRQVAAQFRVDTYDVIRPARTPDDAGGWTETPGVVESGGCVLTAGATRPDERAIAERSQSASPYVIRNIRHDTILKASDTVKIAGRTFEILGVLRAEGANVAVTAVAEERT